ncbi:hypothetical protein NPIL_658961 [Nephila pilipes]|uniref:Uncharacterized protein n=1 Tax=Nephila pilipes TaxID=299642 RepID=A0A8X6PEC6_NEPPI|nr:hypothetical protein NPIL_658961 [Nephila pilipes]
MIYTAFRTFPRGGKREEDKYLINSSVPGVFWSHRRQWTFLPVQINRLGRSESYFWNAKEGGWARLTTLQCIETFFIAFVTCQISGSIVMKTEKCYIMINRVDGGLES